MVGDFFIVGPTAVGKTALGVDLAERVGAEILSADAFQVYRGLDLLTAKPTRQERRRVAHHLVGEIPTSESYNVARYLEDANQRAADIRARGKPMLVIGGAGLYVKALTHGLSPLPPADPTVRAQLEILSSPELFSRLQQLDPVLCETIDRANQRRLVRALEVCLLTRKPFSSFRTEWQVNTPPRPVVGLFLSRERGDLLSRITRRVDAMFVQGVLEEVRQLSPDQLSLTAQQILGLREIQEHLAGQIDMKTCRERIQIATRQYAKRQMTWFKRQTCFEELCLTDLNPTEQIDHLQARWIASSAA